MRPHQARTQGMHNKPLKNSSILKRFFPGIDSDPEQIVTVP